MEGQLISILIQRGAGEDISSEEGWLQALGTWALTKKEDTQSRGKKCYLTFSTIILDRELFLTPLPSRFDATLCNSRRGGVNLMLVLVRGGSTGCSPGSTFTNQ